VVGELMKEVTLLKVESVLSGGACPATLLVNLEGFVNSAAWPSVIVFEMTASFELMKTSDGMLLNGLAAVRVFKRPVCVVGRYPQNITANENVSAGWVER